MPDDKPITEEAFIRYLLDLDAEQLHQLWMFARFLYGIKAFRPEETVSVIVARLKRELEAGQEERSHEHVS